MMSSLMALLRMARSKSAVAPRLVGGEGRVWRSGGEAEIKWRCVWEGGGFKDLIKWRVWRVGEFGR